MKFLIQHDLRWTTTFDKRLPAAELAATWEYYLHLVTVARKFCLGGKFAVGDDSVDFQIHAQKMTLTEWSMNEFFAVFLTELFDIEVEYVLLGGAGCDFVIELMKAVPCGEFVPTLVPTIEGCSDGQDR